MQTPFSDVVGEILDMLALGFKVMVPQFKARTGYDNNPNFNSRYYDGKIGWKSFMPVDPETIFKWNSPRGTGYLGLTGITQLAPYTAEEIEIPRSRMLLFRTTASNNDPTGKSLLEGAYLDWLNKNRIKICHTNLSSKRRGGAHCVTSSNQGSFVPKRQISLKREHICTTERAVRVNTMSLCWIPKISYDELKNSRLELIEDFKQLLAIFSKG